jgi:hypothetical protein
VKARRGGAAVGQAATLHRYMHATEFTRLIQSVVQNPLIRRRDNLQPGRLPSITADVLCRPGSFVHLKIAASCVQLARSSAGPFRVVEVGFDIPDRRGT